MVRYKELGYKTFEDYFKDFIGTLLPSNKTYSYFVNWERVNKNMSQYTSGIKLLQPLCGLPREEITSKLEDLLKSQPKVVLPILPILIAERADKGNITVVDPNKEEIRYIKLNFGPRTLSDDEISMILELCTRSGIIDLLSSIQNLEDYIKGVEVGLDTHARKSRSGNTFEQIVEEFLENKANLPEYISFKRTSKKNRRSGKVPDFTFYKDGKKVVIMEVNFYNVGGSKPSEIIRSYQTVQSQAKKAGIIFIWVTDGPGWLRNENAIKKGAKTIDWIVNYRQLRRLIRFFNSVGWDPSRLL